MFMKKSTIGMAALTGLIGLIALNMLASRHFARLDLTDNRAYTLAPATKQLLKNLPDVVTVRAYFSKALPPQLSGVKRGIDDMLAEYHSYGRNNFQVEYKDPADSQAAEREAMVMGIAPMQVNVVSHDKQEVAKVYLGLAMLFGDKKEIIPVDPRDPTRHLEEWLSSALVKLTREKTPEIGWWGPTVDPQAATVQADGEGYQIIRQVMNKSFTVMPLGDAPWKLSPAQQEAIVVVADKPDFAKPEQTAALGRYLAAGGRVLLFLNRINPKPDFTATAQQTGLEAWLGTLGITVPEQLVADAASQYASFQSHQFTYSVPYVLWPTVAKQLGGFDRAYPGVGQLEALALPWTSPVQVAEQLPEGLTARVLAQSSLRSGVTPGSPPFTLDPQAASNLIPKNNAEMRQPLMVSVTGDFAKVFHATGTGDAKGELVVVGSTHLLEDRFVQQREFGDGLTFFQNMLDHFTIGDTLIGVRSRPVTARPLPATLSESAKLAIRYTHMIGVPVLIVCAGLLAMALRRRRVTQLRDMYC